MSLISVDHEKCNRDGICASECPARIIVMDTETGYVYKTTNAYPPLFEALGLPADHLAFGAMMIGYPKFGYRRIPIRNKPRVTWK